MAATPSAQYSLTIRVEIEHKPGMLGEVATAIGQEVHVELRREPETGLTLLGFEPA